MSDSDHKPIVPPLGDDDAIADLTPPTRPAPKSTEKGKRDSERIAATVRPKSGPGTEPPSDPPSSIPPSSPVPATRPRITEGSTFAPIFQRTPANRAALPVERVSLEAERILRDAQRVVWEGATCPALGGIPLLSKLGEGGMGSVYFGIHPRLNNPVAVKVLPHHLAEKDPTLVDRFVREAQIAASVRSPHLVHVIDVNQDAGLYFLVMEYVCGQTGAKLLLALRKSGQVGIPLLAAIDTCVAAAVGLKAAHNYGVIHRDIKPDNIIIPYSKPSGSPEFSETTDLMFAAAKLMDLGLARVQSSQSLTVTQSTMGTPGYMAPEQSMDAKSADQRSDVFSMGATLYALLAGRSPFQRESQMKTLFATVHDPPTPITTYRSDIQSKVIEVLERAMAKEPAARHPSIDAFLTDLCAARDMCVAGILTASKPPTPMHQTGVLPKNAVHPVEVQQPPPAASGKEISVEFVRSLAHAARSESRQAPPAWPPAASSGGKWRTRQFAAVGAAITICVALLAGTAYVTLRRPALPEQTRKAYLKDHDDHIASAKKLADAGNFMDARSALDIAALIPLDEEPARQAEREARKYIGEAERGWTRQYQQQLVAFDSIIESQSLENAPEALTELKKFAPANGSDDLLIAAKEDALRKLQNLREREQDLGRSLDDAAKLEPAPALAELEKIRANLAGDGFKNSKALPELEKRLHELAASKRSAQNTLDQQRATAQQKELFESLLAKADSALNAGGDLALAQTALDDAAKLFPAEPKLTSRRETLDKLTAERERAAQLSDALTNAGKLVTQGDWDNAELILKDIDALSPDNKEVAALRERSKTLQAEALKKATEQERREKAAALFGKFDASLNKGNLKEAESALALATELEPAAEELKSRRELLGKKVQQQKDEFEKLIREAQNSLAQGARIAEAGEKLDQAGRIFADDPRIKTLHEQFVQAKADAEFHEKARQKLKGLEQSIPDAGDPEALNKLADVRAQFDAMAHGHENDPLLKPFAERLDQKLNDIKHVEFLALIKNVNETMDKDLPAAEKLLAQASPMFPTDPELKAANERLDTRKRFEGALGALRDGLERDTKLSELEAQLAEAERLVPNNPKLAPYRAKVVQRQTEARYVEFLAAAREQMSRDDQLTAAQKSLDQAERLLPGDGRAAEARTALAARQADLRRRDDLAALEKEVQPLLKSEATLADAERKIAAMDLKYPGDALYARLRSSIATQHAAFQKSAFLSRLTEDVDALIANESTLPDAEARVRDAEKMYPGDAQLVRLRNRIANRRQELQPQPIRHDPVRETPRESRPGDSTRSGPNANGGSASEMNIEKD